MALLWRLHPNGGRVAAVAVPKGDVAGLVAQGWLRINGERAVIQERLHDERDTAALRIVFDRPYSEPHP